MQIEEVCICKCILLHLLVKDYRLLYIFDRLTKQRHNQFWSRHLRVVCFGLTNGFRSDRSRTEFVWAYRWLVAKVIAEYFNINITGIDVSAFCTIKRKILIDTLKQIVVEDQLGLIQFLLGNINDKTKIIVSLDNHLILTRNIGIPQGDHLNPVLFIFFI